KTLVKFIGGRAASAVIGLFMLAIGSSANAQNVAGSISTPVQAVLSNAVVTPSGAVVQTQPAQSVTINLEPGIAKEAAWLFKAGWPLYALVDKFASNAQLD